MFSHIWLSPRLYTLRLPGSLTRVALTQEVALECTCCLQRYYPDKALNDAVAAALFGAELYSVCPVCGQNAGDDLLDDGYKSRWRRTIRKQLSDTRHTLLMFLSLILSKQVPSTDKVFTKALMELQQLYPDKTLVELKLLGDEALRYMDAACAE